MIDIFFMVDYTQISEELKEAMKSGDTFKRDVLRLVQSALKNVAIDKRKEVATLSPEEVEEVLKRLVKQRKDSITQYEAGGRADLATGEKEEMVLLEAYLPKEMEDEELTTLIRETLASAGMTAKDQMGKAMGAAVQAVAGRAGGDRVKAVVEMILQ
jgi:uncharacterized protein YqeY